MISWTELIIVVKFIFQFGFYPWNKQSEVVKNSPQVYKAQYVLGVQKMEYFAVWDVILLIALFLHRYMLRRIGLWKDANVADTFANPKRSSANSGIEEGAAPSFVRSISTRTCWNSDQFLGYRTTAEHIKASRGS